MKKTIITFITGLVAFGLTQAEVQNGSPAPDFSLTNLDGETVSLDSFKGKTVVLEWNNPSCPFVKKFYAPGKMQALQQSTIADGGVWLTINSSADGKPGSLTSEEASKKMTNYQFAGTEYLFDRNGKVGKIYGAKTTPHIYIIDQEGNLAYQGAIDSVKSTSSDDIAEATNYVETTLAALKAGTEVKPAKTKAYGCGVKY